MHKVTDFFRRAYELLIAGTTALQSPFLLLLRGTILYHPYVEGLRIRLVGVRTNREESLLLLFHERLVIRQVG